MRQLSFLPRENTVYQSEKGQRKIARPFHPKLALHVTMRSSLACGSLSMHRRDRRLRIQALVITTSERHNVRVYRFANVGNHLHLLLQARSRKDLRAFLREFAGRVAMIITGAIKGRPKKFWDSAIWSKIVNWGRHFKSVVSYILLNVMEAAGFRDRDLLARLERDGVLIIEKGS